MSRYRTPDSQAPLQYRKGALNPNLGARSYLWKLGALFFALTLTCAAAVLFRP